MPAPPLPLWQVAGAKDIVRVHVPFFLTDPSQIEKRLGSFSSDPNNYLKEFKYLTQSYNLTWHDIYIILSSTLLPEEKERVWQAVQARADGIRRLGYDTKPVGATAVPRDDPNGDYQAGRPGQAARNHMVACLVVGPSKGLTVAGKPIPFLINAGGHLLCCACLIRKKQGFSGLCYGG